MPSRCPSEVEAEHRVLLTSYARLQSRVSAWCTAQQRQQQALEAEVVRLRGQVLRWQSQCAWLSPAPLPWHTTWAQAEADALLCQTSCVAFGLNGDEGGTCRRSQQPCVAPRVKP